MLVTISIANYDYARFVGEAIESALAQTHRDTEVVVVDDGSTDGSRDVIRAYGERVTAVFKENGGMASSQNAGFAASHGALVVFLDSDDVLLPTAAARAAESYAEGVSQVYWPMRDVDGDGTPLERRLHPAPPLREGNLRDLVVAEGPFSYEWAFMSGIAWGRPYLERVMPIPEDLFRKQSDSYLNLLAAVYGEIRAVNEPQTDYRMHGRNDWAGQPLTAQMTRILENHELLAGLLTEHLARLGIEAPPSRWRETNAYYRWLVQTAESIEDIRSAVPEGARFILVDNAEWTGAVDETFVAGRCAIPFPERSGKYWGPPSDDDAAIAELDRIRESGVRFFVFAWPAFWWLDHYRRLVDHLRSTHTCVLENDRVVVFDLVSKRQASPAEAA